MPAAHRSLPSPPPLATAALLAVFQRWGLRYGLTVNPGRPCGTRDWIYSFAQNASVDCSCDGSPEHHRILESDRDPAGALQLNGAGLSVSHGIGFYCCANCLH
uniref:Uncharacterized protein n=1 Tax=Aegilops tauschii subsp. strangulata TaxID=200361 RepID=A0A453BI89_AEGTS